MHNTRTPNLKQLNVIKTSYIVLFPTVTRQHVCRQKGLLFCPQPGAQNKIPLSLKKQKKTTALFVGLCFSKCSIGAAGPCEVSVVVEGFSRTRLQDLHQSCKASHFLLGALLVFNTKRQLLNLTIHSLI